MKSTAHSINEMNEDTFLAELIEEYTTRLQNGELLNPEDLILEHQEQAEQLRRLLPAVHMLAGCGKSSPDRHDVTVHVEPPSPGEVLGAYRLIREIGRGGMGVVYAAEERVSTRKVAVKVLSAASHLDARQLRRFQIEAEAASGLDHPHIVPVYDVGSERGVHFYAMQLIDGQSLDQLLWRFQSRCGEQIHSSETDLSITGDGLPPMRTTLPDRDLRLPVRTVVRLAVQAALALEHAHQQGVVHRDIKPGNLLVDRQREHLWIADFGLARCQGDSNLTRTGDLLGTLRYMSPEQALAKPGLVDHRTDIYALGATLYELLTLRPVFPGETRQELLKQVADQEPLPLRRHIHDLPVDLETIVLKSLAKNPSERYLTAQELADDLQRVLDNRPILARRRLLIEKVAKWGKRHQRMIACAATATLLLVIALSISTFVIVGQRNEARLLKETARSAVDDMYVGFVQEWLSQKPLLEAEQQALLLKALQHYQGLARDSGADPAVRLSVAHARHCMADIQAKLGNREDAQNEYEAALALLRLLEQEKASLPGLIPELAGCWNDFGNLQRESGQITQAESAFRTARVLYAREANSHPENPAAWAGLAGCSVNLGALLGRLSRDEESESLFREAMAIDRHWVAESAQAPSWRFNLALAIGSHAEFEANRSNNDIAEWQYETALKYWIELAADYPERLNYRQALISAQCSQATLLQTSGKLPEAEKQFQAALRSTQKLCEDFPRVPAFKQHSASVRTRLARVLRGQGQPGRAESCLREARQQLTLLMNKVAEKASICRELAACELELAELLEDNKDLQQAEAVYRQAATHAEAASTPGPVEVLWLRAQIGTRLGNLLFDSGKRSEGKAALAAALSAKELVAAAQPDSAGYQADLAWSLLDCRDVEQRNPARAVEFARRSTLLRPKDAEAWLVSGATLYRVGRWQEAVAALEKSSQLDRGGQTAVCYYLALGYQKLDEPRKARSAMTRAESRFAASKSTDHALTELREEARQALARLSSLPPAPTPAAERTNG